jgi:hypothetical protein
MGPKIERGASLDTRSPLDQSYIYFIQALRFGKTGSDLRVHLNPEC